MSSVEDFTKVAEVKKIIPEALFDCISEKLRNDPCYSDWQCCLECIVEMTDTWEEVNGKDLIWVPGHFEKPKRSLTSGEMENYLVLNGQEIELTDAQYEEIVKSISNTKGKSCFDRVNRGCTYSFITSGGGVIQLPDSRMNDDNGRYDSANYCTNQQLIEQRAFYEKVERNLWRFSMENGGSGEYIIYYAADHDEWGHYMAYDKYFGPSFKTAEIARRAIDEIILPLLEKEEKRQPCDLFEWRV